MKTDGTPQKSSVESKALFSFSCIQSNLRKRPPKMSSLGGRLRELKVIPLKLFYYQTFFETWRNYHSWYEHLKNAIKKWGHRACLRVSRLLKWGILNDCALKIRIIFTQYLVSVSWETQSFIVKAKLHLLTKALLLHLSCFWLLGCGNIALFGQLCG